MNNLFHHAKKLVLLAAGLSLANVSPAQTELWNGSSGNWSAPGNWSAGVIPLAGTNVLFTNNVGAATAAGTVDNIVDAGFGGTVAALQYANTNLSNGSGFYHTTQIASGQTLIVTNGLTVGTLTDGGANCVVNAAITGAGGKLVLTGPNNLVVNQASATGGLHTSILNLTNLDTLVASAGRLQVGVANGVNRAEGTLYLAKTNIITLSGAAPQLYLGFNNGNNNGNNNFPGLYLGQSNSFAVDSITISADKQGNPASRLLFNPVFTNNNPVAYFRGVSGSASRVSSWILGNNSGQTTTGSTSDGTNDFSFGILDAMVDTMTIGMSERGAGATAGSGFGTFTFSAGTNNVNTLFLGYRVCTAGNSVGIGTMNVNGTGTLIVNNAICLSFWSGGNNVYGSGTLNINGGSVWANTITNGVPGGGNLANINVTGGTLGITSLLGSIGTPASPINTLSLADSTLQLPVSGIQTNVVVSTLVAGGTSNIINISSIPASVISYPTQIPLITYTAPGGFNFAVSNLPGIYQGYVSNNAANSSVDLVLTSGPTNISVLEWKGSAGPGWDATSLNWLNAASPVAYLDGASVLFDDNATGPTTINLTAARSPASMTVSNNTLPYAFSGAGIVGSGSLVKYGSGPLLFTNTGNAFIGGVTINAGMVQFGAGGTNGTLPATGNVIDNGNLVFNHSDNLTVPNTIAGAGTLTKNGNAVLTLAGSNSFSGTAVVNAGTLLVNGVLSGSLTNAAGATIGGTGTNAGPVNVGGTIQASAVSGAPATFTSGDLNLVSGAALKFNLNGPDATVGNGSNDLLNVTGNLNANNNTITLNFAGVPQTASPYTLINYSGSLAGNFNPVVAGTHFTAALNQATPNVINVSLSGTGAGLKWNCATNNGFWDNGISTNWLNTGNSSLSVFYAGDNVLFDDSAVATNLTIAAGVAVSPASVVVNASTHNFTIGGGGEISGSGTLVKLGGGRLTLNTPDHDFTGTALIAGGILQAGNNAALVSATTTVTNGGTLDIHGFAYVNGPQVVTVSGTGVGGNGALINNGGDQQSGFQNITLAGDTTVGGSGRFDMRQSGANPLTLNSADGSPYNLTVLGTNHFNLVSVTVDGALGNVDVKGGTFGLQVNTLINSPGWAGDVTHSITVETNAALSFFNLGAGVPLSRTLILSNGATLYNESGVNAIGGLVMLSGNDTVQVDNTGTTPTLTFIGDITGPGTLIKTGPAVLALNSANDYTGSTLVNAGTVTFNDSGSISNSGLINIAAGAVIDVSARTDTTMTLASGQTIRGNGTLFGNLLAGPGSTVSAGADVNSTGALTVTNTVTLAGTTAMKLNAAAGTSDQLIATNGIAYGGALIVTSLPGSITNGQSFQLFVSASYTGTFTATTLPSAPGLTWTNTLATDGRLTAGVVSGPVPQPGITKISLSGTSLIINGTNGVTGEQYTLLGTTNVAKPLNQWTPVATNTFTGGSFSLTNTVNPGAAQSFYILRVP